MKDRREKLLSHILMVVAPLVMLLMLTVAWFINSNTVALSEMSFAAQDYGPGATLYPSVELGRRDYQKEPGKLSYDRITWGEKLAPEDSDITIENMLPGQCVYYLLSSNKKFTPKLLNVKLTDANDRELPGDEIPTDLLAQCLGVYLIPTTLDVDTPPLVSTDVAISLNRIENDGRLENTLFRDGAAAAKFTIPTADIGKTYILAIFCDPVYGQKNAADNTPHTGTLPGTISFSLTFDAVEES